MAFESLTERFSLIIKKLKGQSRLTENNMDEILSEVRLALLEADVNLTVVKSFLDSIKEKAIGQQVFSVLNPSQMVVKIVLDELVSLLGDNQAELKFSSGVTNIMIAGLQGTGKTTTAGKIANLLKKKFNKKVLLITVDIYRPAAIDQLETLAHQIGVDFYSSRTSGVMDIVKKGQELARVGNYDVMIIDTAGRLSIDEKLMTELCDIARLINLSETLLVVDSMSGQDTYNVANTFNKRLKLTGLVMTKLDGDARGGAALSIRQLTGLPIKFTGVGEKIDDLDIFYPKRMAERILGMGDVVTLIEKAKDKIDEEEAKRTMSRMVSGHFDLSDMLSQMKQVQKMGSLGGILKMIPGMPKITDEQQKQAEKEMKVFEAIYNSMTPEERENPDILRNSRKMRIAKGSGKSSSDINRIIKKYENTRELMKVYSKKGSNNLPGMPFK